MEAAAEGLEARVVEAAAEGLEEGLEVVEKGLVAMVLLGRKNEGEILFGLIVELPWKVVLVLFVWFFQALVEDMEAPEEVAEEVVVAMVVVLVAEELEEDQV